MGVVVDVYSESFLQWSTIMAISEALLLIVIWSLFIYAGLYLTMFIYTFFHEPLLKMLNRRVLALDLPVYFIDESKDGKIIRLRQVELRTKDIEDILADGQIDEDDIILSDIVEEINIPE